MGKFFRHTKALCKKNLINYYRMWCSSIIELLGPIVLMLSIGLWRHLSAPVERAEQSFLDQSYAAYPLTEQVGINWVPIKKQDRALTDFLEFGNLDPLDQDSYARVSPHLFLPKHCYALQTAEEVQDELRELHRDLQVGPTSIWNRAFDDYDPDKFKDLDLESLTNDNSTDSERNTFRAQTRDFTAIAFVQENNRIETDFVTQLQLILDRQHRAYPTRYHEYQIMSFKNQELLDLYLRDKDYAYAEDKPGICFAFRIIKKSDLRYELRLMYNDQSEADPAGSGVPKQTNAAWNPISNAPDTEAYDKYMNNGFAQIENWVANTIMKTMIDPEGSIAMITVPVKSGAFNQDVLTESILSEWLARAIMLMFIVPVFRLTYRMVAEKETRVRESMRMMGLTEFSYWFSWALYWILINTYISIVSVIILAVYLIHFSQLWYIWLMLWIYGMALFGFVIFAQAFFQKARNAAIFTSISYLALSFVTLLLSQSDTPNNTKMIGSLLPPVALQLLTAPLAAFESVGQGLTSRNVEMMYQNYRFNDGIKMLVLDMFLFGLVGIYLDNIMPRQVGQKRKWNYVCTWLSPTYWDCLNICRSKKRILVFEREATVIDYETGGHTDNPFWQDDLKKSRRGPVKDLGLDFETKYIKSENFEAPDIAQLELEKKRRFLKIEDLRKVYENGFRAVDGVNCRMYEGQIFALLGHNGAGKTTCISMLTGMIQSSMGSATVYGYNIFGDDIEDVRRFMGVCPQHDILFDLLTPLEHLSIFYDFKGAENKEKKKQDIEKLLKDVGIWDMRNTKAHQLSGGSRRKLSVAIALCGNSKFVMLDEPTAGMDLQARRSLWDMLRAYRNGRIIILTTHYMDEADVLGDRIGIMAQGKIVCLGRSLFLKKRYGVGYNLTMVKRSELGNPQIEAYLKEELGQDIFKLSEIGREITYQIPVDLSEKFQQFFIDFDIKQEMLGIQGYGISFTTLEEVFLRVGEGRDMAATKALPDVNNQEQENQEDDDQLLDKVSEEPDYSIAKDTSGKAQKCCLGVAALLSKRCTLQRRGWLSSLVFELIVPVLLVSIGFAFTQIQFFYESPARRLETKLFPLPQRIVMNREPVIRTTFLEDYLHTTGFNTTREDWLDALIIKLRDEEKIEAATLFQDNSVVTLMENLPSSYVLATDFDFEVTFNNYTEDLITSQRLAENTDIDAKQAFDLYSEFDQDFFDESQFGAEEPFRFGSYLVYQSNITTNQYKVLTYVNSTSQDVAVAYPSFMYESILKTASGEPNFQFRVVNEPFPILQKYRDQEAETSAISLLFVLAIGFSMLPATIVGAVMTEREKSMKQMQVISGMNLWSYWLVNLIFDTIKMWVPMAVCTGLLFLFQLNDYYWMSIIFAAYPVAIVPFTYATSFLFSTESGAQFFTVFFNVFVMLLLPTVIYFLRGFEGAAQLGDDINSIARILPGYAVSKAVLFCGTSDQLRKAREDFLFPEDFEPISTDPFAFENLLGDLVFMGIISIFSSIMIGVFEGLICRQFWLRWCTNCCKCCFEAKLAREDVVFDPDVLEEEERIRQLGDKELEVKVDKFRKVYRQGPFSKLVAVERASFGLNFGECFCLLGVNGAGKTTTFKSLINDIVPTSGSVSVGGYDVGKDFDKARKLIGFCPQADVLFANMTVEEHLVFFSRIKAVPSRLRSKLVNKTIDEMNLVEYRDKIAGTLSGGNKRKLQVAIAIIGNPPIILLDEPSAGMDPEARRFMWSVVSGLSQRKSSAVILTTHSMEEAEALSSKMGIMVKGGVFKCFGSVQHIKNKYGTGYELEVKIKDMSDDQMNEMLIRFQIRPHQQKISVDDAIQRMTEEQFPEMLLAEIQKGGLGDDLIQEADDNKKGMIKTTRLMEWIWAIEHGMKVILELAQEFGMVELLEQHGYHYKLRVLRQDKTIGFLFGMIEAKKTELGISEYSASQTTLEQIFQMFATMGLTDTTGHLIFQHDPAAPQNLRIIRSNSAAGPLAAAAAAQEIKGADVPEIGGQREGGIL